jgi:hypothetical protein
MERTQVAMEDDLAIDHPSIEYPCDEEGLASTAG